MRAHVSMPAAIRTLVAALAAALVALAAGAQVWEVRHQNLESPAVYAPSREMGAALAANATSPGWPLLLVGFPDSPGFFGQAWEYHATPVEEFQPWNVWTHFLTDARYGASVLLVEFGDELPLNAVGAPLFDLWFDHQLIADSGAVDISGYMVDQTMTAAGPAPGDHFGSALAAGDFDGDGIQDLAVGAPGKDLADWVDAGSVDLFRGRSDEVPGFFLPSTEAWTFGQGIEGKPSGTDRLGSALVAADFDGDGYDDLAIGAPGYDSASRSDIGAVWVVYGSAEGLDPGRVQRFAAADLGWDPVAGERLGAALAAGRFHKRPASCTSSVGCPFDLAIGVPGYPLSEDRSPSTAPTPTDAGGAVVVLHGGSSGLETAGAELLTAASAGGVGRAGDDFGSALATGALDPPAPGVDNAPDDLLVGAPLADEDGRADVGRVYLLFGALDGIASGTPAAQIVSASSAIGLGPTAAGDRFGQALASGDFDDDGWGDVAIGAPGRARDAVDDAGAVVVLFGALFADGFERGDTTGWSARSAD